MTPTLAQDLPRAYGPRRAFAFLAQDCPATLADGMAEFAAAHPELLVPADRELAEFVRAHDACHVLFGLTTALDDEALADTWTLAGTTMTLRRYMAYLRHEPIQQIVADAGAWPLALGVLRSLPRIVRVLWRARRMPHKWPFDDYAAHLHTPLAELRRRYGIRVV
jgi:hypothetical protein